MNRVSAQSARDRKKAYIEDLERQIALLEEKVKCSARCLYSEIYILFPYRTRN